MFYFDISKHYSLTEALLEKQKISTVNLYTDLKQDVSLEELLAMLKEDGKNIDINLAIALFYYHNNVGEKAMKFANECVFISNSYHSYFHYFGFNLGMKIYEQTKEEEFKNKALFFYPRGGEPSEDFLPSYKNLCIFEGSDLHKSFYSNDVAVLKEAFKKSSTEHLLYHIVSADIFLLRGLLWKEFNKPEIARVDFEKALKMEPKNPKNALIKRELQKL